MTKEETISAAAEYVQELFRENSGGHDADHTLRVYRTSLLIAEEFPGCDLFSVALAALLHDTDDPKLFRTDDFANARAFLSSHDVDPATADRVCSVVSEVSFSSNRDSEPTSVEARIVRDADRLDAIGAIGIARTFAYGGSQGRPMEDSLRHFDEKLLLIKDMLSTETAKRLAVRRHDFLLDFLEEYRSENGESLP